MRWWPWRTSVPRSEKLIVGLGNPGPQYEETRHNVGFWVIDRLLSGANAPSQRKAGLNGELAHVQVAGTNAAVLRPLTFMNRSGDAVGPALQRYSLAAKDLIVVHDELDLPVGRMKVKQGGGHGGHNGLRSIIGSIGEGFARVRCGIGRPAGVGVVEHVLSPFASDELESIEGICARAVSAIEAWIGEGPVGAMNRFNGQD